MFRKSGVSLIPTTVSQHYLLIAGSETAYPSQSWVAMPSASRIVTEPFSFRLRLQMSSSSPFLFSWIIFLKLCRVDPSSDWAVCCPCATVLSCFIIINSSGVSREMVHEQKGHNFLLTFGRVGFENYIFKPPFRTLLFIFQVSLFILLYYKTMALQLGEWNFNT